MIDQTISHYPDKQRRDAKQRRKILEKFRPDQWSVRGSLPAGVNSGLPDSCEPLWQAGLPDWGWSTNGQAGLPDSFDPLWQAGIPPHLSADLSAETQVKADGGSCKPRSI